MKQPNSLKNILIKYKHAIILSYFFVYIIWFGYLEQQVTTIFIPVYSKLDDFIPFNEWFIIPYLLWFLFIFATVTYFFFTSRSDYYKCCAYLFIGMTISLIIYSIWPNGHNLRVNLDELGRNNILIDMVAKIYHMDTPTNVFPSIHVFNSIGANIAIYKSERLKHNKLLQVSTLILTVLICMSTVFLKQHSILDVFGAIFLSVVMYVIVYIPDWRSATKKEAEEALS